MLRLKIEHKKTKADDTALSNARYHLRQAIDCISAYSKMEVTRSGNVPIGEPINFLTDRGVHWFAKFLKADYRHIAIPEVKDEFIPLLEALQNTNEECAIMAHEAALISLPCLFWLKRDKHKPFGISSKTQKTKSYAINFLGLTALCEHLQKAI